MTDCADAMPLAGLTSLIIERAMCMTCMVLKTGLTPREVAAALGRIETVLHIDTMGVGHCASCGTETAVVAARPRA
jgi:hypothetical protein